MKIISIRVSHGYGGAEKLIQFLFNYLSDKDLINVTHFTNNTLLYKNLKSNKQRVFKLDYKLDEVGTKKEVMRFVVSIPKYINSYRKILIYLGRSKVDVIILHSTTEKLLLTYLFKKQGYKVIWFEHGPFYRIPRVNLLKIFHRKMSYYTDKVLAVSEDTKLDLINGGVDQNNIIVFHIGVDIHLYKYSKNVKRRLMEVLKISQNSFCIGYIGNVNYEKGIGRFIDVAKNINKETDNISYLVIGTGPVLKEIQMSNRTLANKFIYTGHVDNVYEYLSILDIMFLPTEHYEGVSIAILEAMSASVCVLTKNIGGNSEIISDKINGVLYKKYSIKRISEILLSLKHDHERLEQIKFNARKTIIKKFRVSSSALKFVTILESL